MKIFVCTVLLCIACFFDSLAYASSSKVPVHAAAGNPIVWFQIHTSNLEVSRRFYSQLFDWSFALIYPGYMQVTTGDGSISGGLSVSQDVEPGHGTVLYIGVDDLNQKLDLAVSLGATVVMPPAEIPGTGYYAVFKAPDQNVLALFSSSP